LPSVKSLGFFGRQVIGGWTSSGILTWQDGLPFTLFTGTNNSTDGNNYSVATDRPDLVGNPHLPSNRSTGEKLLEYFNTAAVVPNAAGTYGNTARNFLRGPGYANLDFALIKSIPLGRGEDRRLDFRAEFFNLFNHPNFGAPDNYLTDSTFGQILSAGDPRIVQLALKFIF